MPYDLDLRWRFESVRILQALPAKGVSSNRQRLGRLNRESWLR